MNTRPLHILLLVATAFAISSAHGEDLQVTDYFGLVRAQKNIEGKVSVRITALKNPHAELDPSSGPPLMTQRTGFAADIISTPLGNNEFLFEGVSVGLWRIRMRNRGLLLDSVEILEPGKGERDKIPADRSGTGITSREAR